MDRLNRREFLGGLAAASAFTIVPRRVLGGRGYRAPSDMILLAQIGCGTQAQRQVNAGMVRHPDLQFVAVVDPNRDSSNYVDWSPGGNRSTIRRFLEEPAWGQGDTGIRAGRDVAKEIMEIYYRKQQRPSAGIRAYEDYREMLEKERDIQGIVNITPDHQHASVNIAALRKGKAVIAHKPVAHVVSELRRTLETAREKARSRICSPTAIRRIATRSPRGSTPASLAMFAKCTTGRIGRSGRRAGRSTTRPGPRCRPDSTGSSGRVRSPIGPTIRTTRSRSIVGGMRTAPAAWVTWASTVSGSRTGS